MPKDQPKDKNDPPKEDDKKKDKKEKEQKHLWYCKRCDVYYGWDDLGTHRYCYRADTPLTPESEADDEELKDDK